MKYFFLASLSLLTINSMAATLSQQVMAAKNVANNDPSCATIRPFYWEIGDNLSALVSGSVGIGAPSAKTSLEIASASKWIFSAYVVEKRSGVLRASDKEHLRFLSGHDQFSGCLGSSTVGSCFNSGNNDVQTASSRGKFVYGGGHMQKLAVDMGLGFLSNPGLALEVNQALGTHVAFHTPQPAGGMEATSLEYGFFLRRLMNNQLKQGSLLGAHAVCTTPGDCPMLAISSPAPANWKYSYGHWVEAEEGTFSSPGKFGFYPWIDKSKTYYGVIGRKSLNQNAYLESVVCGQKIRNAFINGK